jgi:hypothetical protein
MYSESRTKYASGIYSSLIVGVLVIAGGALAHSPQDDPIVNSFQKCISDFMASYQTNRHEHVTKLGGGWVKEIYRPIGEPSLDIKRTDSIMSPYLGICEFTLRREITAFHNTKEEAAQDNKFVQSDNATHRHRYAYQSGKWVPKTREYWSKGGEHWYDCNEVIALGANAGERDAFGCWENN